MESSTFSAVGLKGENNVEELEEWVEWCIRLKAKHPKVEEEKLKYRAPTHIHKCRFHSFKGGEKFEMFRGKFRGK